MSNKIDLNNGFWVYLGLIDDKVNDYPWISSCGKKYFNSILQKSALFEDPILLNDGYLLHKDWTLRELLNPKSLLRRLMGKKHVVIFSREESGKLDKMVENTAESVESYEILLKSKKWNERFSIGNTSYRPLKEELIDLSTSSEFYYALWPKIYDFDNSKGFETLLLNLTGTQFGGMGFIEVSGDELINTINCFFKERMNPIMRKKGVRTVWEKTVRESFIGQPKKITELMWLGNEVYHYNKALSLAAVSNGRVGVSTLKTERMCSRYVEKGREYDGQSLQLPNGIQNLSTEQFIDLIDKTKSDRDNYHNSIKNYLLSLTSSPSKNTTEAYCESIKTWFRKDYISDSINKTEKVIKYSAVMAGSAVAAINGLDPYLIGVITGISAIIGDEFSHLVYGWNSNIAKRQIIHGHRGQDPKTGTFLIDKEKAIDHINNSKVN